MRLSETTSNEWKISKLKSCRVEVLILLYIRLAIESSINLHFFSKNINWSNFKIILKIK